MESMVERVARAMCRQVEEDVSRQNGEQAWATLGFDSLDAWVDDCWPNYAGQSRAALLALREPTEAMVSAVAAWVDPEERDCVRRGLTAMIDDVLSHPEGASR